MKEKKAGTKCRRLWAKLRLIYGMVTIGYQDSGKPVELKVDSSVFNDLCQRLTSPI